MDYFINTDNVSTTHLYRCPPLKQGASPNKIETG
jgi:hypothetical protein